MMMTMVMATTIRLPKASSVHKLRLESLNDSFSWKFSSVTESRYLCLTSVKAFFQIFFMEGRCFFNFVFF